MRDLRRRASRRRESHTRRNLIMITLVVMCFACAMMFQMRGLRQQVARQDRMRESLTAEYNREKARAEELAEAQDFSLTEEYIAQVARERLGMVMPDEIIVKSK